MEAGRADTCGRNSSSAASTARRSSSKNSGSFIAAEVGCAILQSRLKTDFLFPTLFRARTVQQRVCHRPSSAESRHGSPLLRVVSGILAKAPRLPQIISWLHQEQAAGSRGGARLLRGALATSRNPVSWAALVFLRVLSSLDQTFSYSRSKRHSKSRWRLQTIDYGTWRQGAGFNVKVCLRAPASATSLNG